MQRISMSKLNIMLSRLEERRIDVKMFLMSHKLFCELVEDSLSNYNTKIMFDGSTLYYDVVQAFGRDVITGLGCGTKVSAYNKSLVKLLEEDFGDKKDIPKDEQWLHDNPKALNSLKKGIEDAKACRVSKGPDLSKGFNKKNTEQILADAFYGLMAGDKDFCGDVNSRMEIMEIMYTQSLKLMDEKQKVKLLEQLKILELIV